MAGRSDIKAGRAYVEMYVKDTALVRGLHRAQQRLRSFGMGLDAIGVKMMAMGAVIVAPLLGMVKHFASVGDSLDKMSARTGLSVESLSELGFAAEQSGADLETLEKGVSGLQKVLRNAERGLSRAVDNLAALGLTYQDLRDLSPEDQLKTVADRLAAIEDPSKRAAMGMQLLGGAGQKLLPMLAGGRAGMEALQQQARDLGLTISTDSAQSAAKFTDEMNILTKVMKTGFFSVAEALLPLLRDMVKWLTDNAKGMREWVKVHSDVIVKMFKFGAGLVVVGAGLMAMGKVVGIVAGTLGFLASAIRVVTVAMTFLWANPVALGLVAAAALTLAIRNLTNETAELRTEQARLLKEADEQRAADQDRLDRLGKLAEKTRLNSREMEEATTIIDTLEGRYGDLGLTVDRLTGALHGVAGAQEQANAAMRKAAELGILAEMAENDQNIRALADDMTDTWTYAMEGLQDLGLGDAGKDAMNREMEALFARYEALKARLAALRAGEAGALTGGGGAAAAGGVPGIMGGGEAAGAEAFNERMQRRIVDLQIAAIEDQEERALAAIDQRYAHELEKAKEIGGDVTTIMAARDQEIENTTAEFAKRREQEEKAAAERTAALRKGLDSQLARAEIEATSKGSERRRRLLQLDRKEALEDARKQGLDLSKVNRLYDLQAGMQDAGEAVRRVAGTFNPHQMMLWGAGSGGGPQQRMVAGIEKVAKAQKEQKAVFNKMLGELRRLGFEMQA